ncbi:hypothetical protein [Endozoicomonas sp. 8E]|uniref:dTMP kinase n=1 Tax=Endozoicomonas sp. 8E TaxID=3035692 RepID=UPI002938E5B3|nr:hypothetical protein [Endozoicomonas sp. 8E]WOG25814.1 hypothetical protein P6910_14650 [Endozoicomonas sp. 8E]
MILVFSGTDGAGKSTQIELLKDYYKDKEKHVKYLWGRGGYTPCFKSVKKLAKRLFFKKISEGKSKERERIIQRKSVSSVWLFIAITDLLMFYGLYARIHSWLGYVVICDRYLEDSCLDFKLNFGSRFKEKGFLWCMVKLLAPKPDKSFLLYVPVELSLERSKFKNEPFPDSPETLKWRLEYYLNEKYFPSEKFCKIECQHSVEAIQALILNHIEAA